MDQFMLSPEIAVSAKIESNCPIEILQQQVIVDVKHFDFEGRELSGQIVVNRSCESDIKKIFGLIHEMKFPLARVIPVAAYNYDDILSCKDNNCSGFNYRTIAGSDKLSKHATGEAFDLNPLQNPYIRYGDQGEEIYHEPENAIYDASVSGTLYKDHPIVKLCAELGWEWGGIWPEQGFKVVDYQHFEKLSV